MDLMKDIYKKELRTRIAAWEGKKKEVQAAQDAKKESVSKVQEAI